MLVRSVCIVLLCASVAMAQKEDRTRLSATPFRKGEAVKQAIGDARWRTGNLYISPIIGFRRLGYDDNVFSTETNQVNDFSLAPEVGVQTYYRPGNRWIWANRLSYDYLYYFDLDNLRGSEYSGESRLYGIFKRQYLDFGAVYNEDRQRLTSEIDDRITSQRFHVDFNYSIQPTVRAIVAFGARTGRLEYDETETTQQFRALERDESRAYARFHYRAGETLWPFFELERQEFDFLEAGNPRDDTSFTSVFVGLRTENTRRLSVEGKVGVTQMDFQPVPLINGDGEVPGTLVDLDDDVLSLEMFFHYKMSRRTYVEGSLLNTPLFSVAEGYTYFVSGKQSLEIGWETRRKLRLGPEVVLGTNDYRKSFSTLEDPLREDTLRGLNFNVTFPLRRLFEWKISAGYLERDSNKPGISDEGYQIGSTVRYKRI